MDSATAFVVTFVAIGIGILSFGVFFKHLIKEFGWNRASAFPSFNNFILIGAITSPLIGTLNDKYGPKWVMITGAFGMGLVLIILYFLESLWGLYLLYGLMGIGFFGLLISSMAVISNWFIKKRGTAIGIMFIGIGTGE